MTGPAGSYAYASTTAGVFSNPHAATTIGATTLAYDTYDHTGNRIKKTDTVSSTPTYYMSPTYEVEGTVMRHHAITQITLAARR